MATFPTTIYVKREDDGNSSYLLADEDLHTAADHGENVAIYQLVTTAKMRVTKELVDVVAPKKLSKKKKGD